MSSASHRDSPRRRRVRAPKPVARSASEILFGTIKSIVNAPFSWITGHNEFEDTPGKRRRNPEVVDREQREQDGGEGRAKRKRVHSPQPDLQPSHQHSLPPNVSQQQSGYLDMPESMVRAPGKKGQHTSSHARSASVAVGTRSDLRLPRFSHSPAPRSSIAQAVAIGRTQSMDPPGVRVPPITIPRAISRDISMGDIPRASSIRDITISPTRTQFAMRSHSSMTPQLSGQDFGPAPMRRERNPSEPPPLEALMSNPIFVRPPPASQRQELQRQPTLTLGSLAEGQRTVSHIFLSHCNEVDTRLILLKEPIASQATQCAYVWSASDSSL